MDKRKQNTLSLVKICHVVLEKKRLQTNRQTDDRWAKNCKTDFFTWTVWQIGIIWLSISFTVDIVHLYRIYRHTWVHVWNSKRNKQSLKKQVEQETSGPWATSSSEKHSLAKNKLEQIYDYTSRLVKIHYNLPLKRSVILHLKKIECPYQRMFNAKFDWNWTCSSGEKGF